MNTTFNIDIFEKHKDCLTKNIYSLNKFISNKQLILPELKSKGGVYAFWWIGNDKELMNSVKKCKYKLKGKQSEKELWNVLFTEKWVENASYEKKVCLYVGKSTDIKGRISKHIKLGTLDIWKKSNGEVIRKDSGIKPNTESQLRTGIERLFEPKLFHELIDNIGISWIIIDKYENGINRFFLEDYFIGKFFPLLNIDIER